MVLGGFRSFHVLVTTTGFPNKPIFLKRKNALLIFEHSLPVCGAYMVLGSQPFRVISKYNVMLYLHIPLLLSFFSQPCHLTLSEI